MNDLQQLLDNGLAERWVGKRSIVYDGFPTMGKIYNQKGSVDNAFCATHFGSGGVSDAPIAVMISRSSLYAKPNDQSPLVNEALKYGRSNRKL